MCTHKYIFLWLISFVWASRNFETCFKPHTEIACESMYGISLKRSKRIETKNRGRCKSSSKRPILKKMIKETVTKATSSQFPLSAYYTANLQYNQSTNDK